MTLPYQTEINGEPNFFIEKIWTGLPYDIAPDYYSFRDEHQEKFGKYWDGAWTDQLETCFPPKRHTIREDAANRWRAGMDIHSVINNRTKNRFQFAPVVKCVSVQKINIYPFKHGLGRVVIVEGDRFDTDYMPLKGKGLEELTQLAINDGFDSVEDFFKYFNTDFKGKLIHWTSLKY